MLGFPIKITSDIDTVTPLPAAYPRNVLLFEVDATCCPAASPSITLLFDPPSSNVPATLPTQTLPVPPAPPARIPNPTFPPPPEPVTDVICKLGVPEASNRLSVSVFVLPTNEPFEFVMAKLMLPKVLSPTTGFVPVVPVSCRSAPREAKEDQLLFVAPSELSTVLFAARPDVIPAVPIFANVGAAATPLLCNGNPLLPDAHDTVLVLLTRAPAEALAAILLGDNNDHVGVEPVVMST